PPERQRTMQLPDGRRLAWSEWGPVDGIPVLFCTGAAMSSWLGFGVNELPTLDLRLIAIDRPGLGLSDPYPNKTLSSWVEDMREFIGSQKLQNVLAVAFSQGAPFAFALAAQNLIEALAIVSGQDDLTHPDVLPLVHPDVKGMIAAIGQDATGFEQHFSQIATAEGLWQLIIGMSAPQDRLVYESEPFSQAFRKALEDGFLQGARGYARDLVNALSPWHIKLEEISIPVDLWYGGLDTSTVHSPDFGATLVNRLSLAKRIFEPNEGGSILWTKSEEILSKLKSHLLIA
ncbi:alpha/beta hydrolase, partial [Ancylothrix sp. C2]|uniref:alpha/beta fold hydrolase n=1 Tax=Ancylothrix sp. D3o TaxID=2953691 RepID=UPI0021BA87C1